MHMEYRIMAHDSETGNVDTFHDADRQHTRIDRDMLLKVTMDKERAGSSSDEELRIRSLKPKKRDYLNVQCFNCAGYGHTSVVCRKDASKSEVERVADIEAGAVHR